MDVFRKYFEEIIENNTIYVIGAGGWGTALSNLLAYNGYNVVLWAREPELIDSINKNRVNNLFLPKIKLSEKVIAVNDLAVLKTQKFFVSAIPTQYIRKTFTASGINLNGKKVLNVAKGIEIDTLKRGSEIFAQLGVSSEDFAVLTGPSHAEEVGLFQPTTVVTSSEDISFSRFIQILFSNDNFRVYTSQDIVGCELGGSIKNVIAIAAGIIDGLQFGDNTKAALITRGLAEISRLSVAMGANALTITGLSGLGDLIVTCNSKHSRNRKVGELIGLGKNFNEIINEMQMIAEGVETTKSAYNLAQKHKVEMPIVTKVHQILFDNLPPEVALKDLMTREYRHELG